MGCCTDPMRLWGTFLRLKHSAISSRNLECTDSDLSSLITTTENHKNVCQGIVKICS